MTTLTLPSNISRTALLLGAGFSKNFGGFLASEVNELLFANRLIRSNLTLTNLLKKESNYEYALAYARQFLPDHVKTLEQAIIQVYQVQNEVLFENIINKRYFPSTAGVESFFWMLRSDPVNEASFVFSLNQDLLIERLLRSRNCVSETVGIHQPYWHYNFPSKTEIDMGHRFELDKLHAKRHINDTVAAVENISLKNLTNVIKLHGSSEWQNESGDLLIVGGDKHMHVNNSPLLSHFFGTFCEVLKLEGMKLMIIGYSFSDPHINNAIRKGIESGLELWIWDRYPSREVCLKAIEVNDPDIRGLNDIDTIEYVSQALAVYINFPMSIAFSKPQVHQRTFHPTIDSFFSR